MGNGKKVMQRQAMERKAKFEMIESYELPSLDEGAEDGKANGADTDWCHDL